MPRFQYVCPECDNTVPAERVEKRVPGSKGQTRVHLVLICEKDDQEMVRGSYVPPRREVRD